MGLVGPVEREQAKEDRQHLQLLGYPCAAKKCRQPVNTAVAGPPPIISHNACNTIAMQLALKPGRICEQGLQVPKALGSD